MLTATATFMISWTAFLFVAAKEKFPLYVLTGYVGIIFALITDLLMFVYPLWDYPGTKAETFSIQLMNAFGVYFIVIYFFLQSLPKRRTIRSVALHIFCWTLFAITLELFYLYIGFIEHGLWWNLGFSYAADWMLFLVFYFHHKWASVHSLLYGKHP
ncbi:CBO0543 family protein [Shouchella shacheensis]|uniref:CBO0543 family protein n=1 Tax=Shouchella shacheensis TaxID=1649580 RepID=UPI0007400305|nr:CBO0543 family protein [Shouchella shacheensis]